MVCIVGKVRIVGDFRMREYPGPVPTVPLTHLTHFTHLTPTPHLTYTCSMTWQSTDTAPPTQQRYAPLLDTARLYAGWLLAWYALVFLFGGQQALGRLPFDIDWIEGIYRSPLVITFAFGTFFFLMLSTLHRAVHGKTAMATLLTLVWIAGTAVFALNT